MTLRKWLALVVAGAALLAGSARAQTVWRKGIVELSDGRTIVGEVYVPGGEVIVFNPDQKRRYTVPLEQLSRLDTLVEKESMEKKWFFKEDGRDEKVYLDEVYPVRTFLTRVTYHDGKTLTGHILAKTLYVQSEAGRERYQILVKMEGAVGQTLEDLVYVRSLQVLGGEGGVLGTISGRVEVPAGERLLKVLAANRTGQLIIEGSLDQGDAFRFVQCTAGKYDLIVVTDRSLYLWFGRENEENCARFGPAQLDEIAKWAASIRDFFHRQDPLYGAGNAQLACMLMRQERYGGTSIAAARLVRRYEVWLMNKPYDQWQIVKRLYVTRELSQDEKDPRERIVISPALGGIVIDAQHSSARLELELGKGQEITTGKEP